ncbi:MAG: hypothetical protein KAS04_01290 [Candidatus Aenigmarchaeota archaeon]|nr:hypothetical protein [Candidatus Aenigmarchaeota archaeon]
MKKDKLNWYNLLNNKCPECGCTLYSEYADEYLILCENEDCGFTISKDRKDLLLAKMKEQKFYKRIGAQDNQGDLNNL